MVSTFPDPWRISILYRRRYRSLFARLHLKLQERSLGAKILYLVQKSWRSWIRRYIQFSPPPK